MELISTTTALRDAVSELSRSEFITVDTEFIRETTFWPELCLIQMAAPGTEAMVDALAPGLDLEPFFGLMGDEAVVKVFHAARQDIEIVFHRGGLIPHPVFDTQVAAMVCGFGDSVSYDQLVQRITGNSIDKSSRFTDWRRRPLSQKQLAYALADVTYLIDVYRRLEDELRRENRAHWLEDEMEALTARETYDIRPEEAWNRLRKRLRKPAELAVMRSVAAWREREARSRNVPRGRVLKDDAIYEIAQQQPTDPEKLSRLRTIPRGRKRSGDVAGLLKAVNDALALPRDRMPSPLKPKRPPNGAAAAAELLKVLLRMTSEDSGVAARVLASGDDIDKLAAEGEKADIPALNGWRREVFGDPALKLIRGETALRYRNGKVATEECRPG